jgi:cytochrome c-type biogenesis protein CcmE
VVDATYTGIVPDTFKDASEVVIKGRLSPAGFAVDPNGIMAKCPSKYEPKSGVAAGPKQ